MLVVQCNRLLLWFGAVLCYCVFVSCVVVVLCVSPLVSCVCLLYGERGVVLVTVCDVCECVWYNGA